MCLYIRRRGKISCVVFVCVYYNNFFHSKKVVKNDGWRRKFKNLRFNLTTIFRSKATKINAFFSLCQKSVSETNDNKSETQNAIDVLYDIRYENRNWDVIKISAKFFPVPLFDFGAKSIRKTRRKGRLWLPRWQTWLTFRSLPPSTCSIAIKNIFRLRVWGSDENQAGLTNGAFSLRFFPCIACLLSNP